jgi:hypothetical protein
MAAHWADNRPALKLAFPDPDNPYWTAGAFQGLPTYLFPGFRCGYVGWKLLRGNDPEPPEHIKKFHDTFQHAARPRGCTETVAAIPEVRRQPQTLGCSAKFLAVVVIPREKRP